MKKMGLIRNKSLLNIEQQRVEIDFQTCCIKYYYKESKLKKNEEIKFGQLKNKNGARILNHSRNLAMVKILLNV